MSHPWSYFAASGYYQYPYYGVRWFVFLIAYRRLDITLRQSVTVGLNKPLMDLGLPLKFLSHLVHKAIVLFHPLHRQLQVWLLSIHMALMAPIFLILWGLILAIRRWMLLNDGMP